MPSRLRRGKIMIYNALGMLKGKDVIVLRQAAYDYISSPTICTLAQINILYETNQPYTICTVHAFDIFIVHERAHLPVHQRNHAENESHDQNRSQAWLRSGGMHAAVGIINADM